jgi:hypothetical protein
MNKEDLYKNDCQFAIVDKHRFTLASFKNLIFLSKIFSKMAS